MTPTAKDFPPGTRCRLRTSRHQYASTSAPRLYIHLGATPYLTGTVTHETPLHSELVAFRPDGWPLPEGVSPLGFMARVACLEAIDDRAASIPCVISSGTGVPVSPADIHRLVDEYINRKGK